MAWRSLAYQPSVQMGQKCYTKHSCPLQRQGGHGLNLRKKNLSNDDHPTVFGIAWHTKSMHPISFLRADSPYFSQRESQPLLPLELPIRFRAAEHERSQGGVDVPVAEGLMGDKQCPKQVLTYTDRTAGQCLNRRRSLLDV